MTITNWPQQDKPREKLLQHTERMLTDAELIAIFLNSGMRGKTALDLARELLQEHGGLKKLARATPAAILAKPGMGPAKYAALKAAIELGRRCLHEPLYVGETLNNFSVTQAFLIGKLRQYDKEVFACLFMDCHFRLLAFEELFYGTVDHASVYPREIVRRCLELNAVNIILTHNHPSGIPTPSIADKNLTHLIRETAALIDVEVIDHIIIGNPETFSFAEAGMI